MMNTDERAQALHTMEMVSSVFYSMAVRIGVHPFIEFTGLMNEYIKACQHAHAKGIDFTNCNAHSGVELPLEEYMVRYINEKLNCIFGDRVRMA